MKKLENMTARQLSRQIRRGWRAEGASYEWARRIESDKVRCALPKKQQRQLGILPQV